MADCLPLTDLHSAVVGDEGFRIPWELRSFALGVAVYEADDFDWGDFQQTLVAAIAVAEDEGRTEHYYQRWVEALEGLLQQRGGLDTAELDRRTQEILSTPRDDTHDHDHDHDRPVTTVPAG